MNEIYKGLKQNDYLKVRLTQTEDALKSAGGVIDSQNEIILKKNEIISLKDEVISTNQVQYLNDKSILGIEIKRLNDVRAVEQTIAKKESRKNYWKGIKTGGIIGIVASAAAVFLLVK